MTAVSAQPTTLPHIIRQLEAAEPGDLAIGPTGKTAMKMEHDSGRPWLLDPWDHVHPPERMTTAALTLEGYMPENPRETPARQVVEEPSLIAAQAVADTLIADGWTRQEIASAAGVSRKAVSNLLAGKKVWPASAGKIQSIDRDSLTRPRRITLAEQVEDMEWLLSFGTPPEEVADRCGYADAGSAANALRKAGRHDLSVRMYTTPEPADVSLDDYDPYNDPNFI